MGNVIDHYGAKAEAENTDEENFYEYPEFALSPNSYSGEFRDYRSNSADVVCTCSREIYRKGTKCTFVRHSLNYDAE